MNLERNITRKEGLVYLGVEVFEQMLRGLVLDSMTHRLDWGVAEKVAKELFVR